MVQERQLMETESKWQLVIWQLQNTESNMGVCSMLEQGRDTRLFLRGDKTKMPAAAPKLKSFFEL